ncbi:hypothetical protein T4A_4821 [Trichinella pseudospiralis]|uniref:Transposon Ty3-I Gag-Pol polyprotein n=1 Tax=Trichinella pseudospiralis TaxID=6337 RepID=A0A0V1JVJ8_TRIPS|nr:hypothetical protein T4A_4821 [Trichinella pseudospiralis]KRZ38980.1 hypothetical protein T4C_13595 [Trichinella pseudospiralis]
MMQTRVKEPAFGPWCSPVVLVWKKDGSLRFCVDHRRMSSVTRHFRIDVWLLAGRSCRKRAREDGVFHLHGTLPILSHAVWAVQRPGDVSAANGKSTEGTNVKRMPRLSRRYYRLPEDRGRAPGMLESSAVSSAVRGSEYQA